MQVSISELRSLLKQSFEGIGASLGLYETAADSIVWSQAHGYSGLDLLQQNIGSLDLSNLKVVNLKSDSIKFLKLDVSSSAAFWGCSVVGLGVINALKDGLCDVQIMNGHDHVLMLKNVADAAKKGLYARLSWPHQDRLIVANISPDEIFFDCVEYELQGDQSMTLLSLSTSILPDNNYGKPVGSWSSKQSRLAYDASLDKGITISPELWAQLGVLATNVLVESTERSRHGAGA